MSKYKIICCLAAILSVVATQNASAAVADPTTLVATAETAFEAVAALLLTIAGFFIVYRIVKRINAK